MPGCSDNWLKIKNNPATPAVKRHGIGRLALTEECRALDSSGAVPTLCPVLQGVGDQFIGVSGDALTTVQSGNYHSVC